MTKVYMVCYEDKSCCVNYSMKVDYGGALQKLSQLKRELAWKFINDESEDMDSQTLRNGCMRFVRMMRAEHNPSIRIFIQEWTDFQ